MKKIKKLFKDPAFTGALGVTGGVTITRIVDGGNVLGAIAAGVVIGIIVGIALNIALAYKNNS